MTDLVTTLSGLDVHDFPHVSRRVGEVRRLRLGGRGCVCVVFGWVANIRSLFSKDRWCGPNEVTPLGYIPFLKTINFFGKSMKKVYPFFNKLFVCFLMAVWYLALLYSWPPPPHTVYLPSKNPPRTKSLRFARDSTHNTARAPWGRLFTSRRASVVTRWETTSMKKMWGMLRSRERLLLLINRIVTSSRGLFWP